MLAEERNTKLKG